MRGLILSFVAGTVFTCGDLCIADGSLEDVATSVGGKAQTAVFDIIDKDVATVNFEDKSANVSSTEEMTLKSLVKSSRDDGKIEKVIIAVWSDKDLPVNKKSLSGDERRLADKRAEQVKTILKDAGVTEIETYTMADKANWFENVFNMSDAKVKKGVAGKGMPKDPKYRKIANVLKDKGGASKAVVIIKRRNM